MDASPTPLDLIQDGLLETLHAGEPLDRTEILAEHPDHAEALGEFLDMLEVLEGPLDDAGPTPTQLGDFEIVREIGRGGMGVVYEARQISLNRPVALKLLPAAVRADPRLRMRFQREAEAAGRLRHPGIVPVFSVGEAGGAPFFAMELVDGRSLADVVRLRREGHDAGLPLEGAPWRRWVAGCVADVADALAAAHAMGVIHRDVKPANVMLGADGRPRLSDFGLALDTEASELTRSGEVFGSPLYMSPEQAFRSRHPVDARTDVYSLGVTLYELLTLRLPYESTSQGDVLSALGDGRILAPRDVDPDIPPALETLVLRTLAIDPGERFESPKELARDLRAWLDHELAPAVPAAGRTQAAGRTHSDAHAASAPASASASRWWTPWRWSIMPWRWSWPRLNWGAWVAVGVVGLFLSVALIEWIDGLDRHDPPAHRTLDTPQQTFRRTGGVPSALEIERMVEGRHPYGVERMLQFVNVECHVRDLATRDDTPDLSFVIEVRRLEEPAPGAVVLVTPEVSVNGGAWLGISPHFEVPLSEVTRGPGLRSEVWIPLNRLESVDLSADSVRIQARATVGVRPMHHNGAIEIHRGTGTTVTLAESTAVIVDTLPEDMVVPVTEPELDRAMRDRLTPDAIAFRKLHGNTMTFELHHDPFPQGPAWGVFRVELLDGPSDTLLGETWISFQPGDSWMPSGMSKFVVELEFPIPGEYLSGLYAGLRSGSITSLHVRMTPSREHALLMPSIDVWWGGTLDLDLPLVPALEQD
jgi:hypothetical protein